MKVKRVMHRGVVTAAPADRVVDIAKVMKKMDVGMVPVLDDNKLVGIVTDRDLACRAIASGKRGLLARDVMSRRVAFCRENDGLATALRLMKQRKVRRLPVVGKDGEMIGVLSLGDIAAAVKPGRSTRLLATISAYHGR